MSVENSYRRNEALWRDRDRGQSFQNSKDCDAIFRQFFHIDLERSMRQFEIANEQMQANDRSFNTESD